jgi:Kdo2-lipid IVA lauroyltransferase/acyltransferase
LGVARSKSPLQIELEYATVRGLGVLLRWLPLSAAVFLAHTLLRTLLALMAKRRKIVELNLIASLPELSERDIRRIADQSLNTLARGVTAFVRTPRYVDHTPVDWVDAEGLEYLEQALRQGRGVIAFTAHFGCWEMMSTFMMMRKPGQVAVVYRQMDNPKIDRWVAGLRTTADGRVIERRKLLREGLRWLKDNKILGILVDQNFAAGGAFVPFLGRIAATTPIVSILARRTGAVVLPLHNRWEGSRLRVIWEPPLKLSDNPNLNRAIHEDTAKMNSVVESWIRKDPGQWLWLHNRWKRQPQPGEMDSHEMENDFEGEQGAQQF